MVPSVTLEMLYFKKQLLAWIVNLKMAFHGVVVQTHPSLGYFVKLAPATCMVDQL